MDKIQNSRIADLIGSTGAVTPARPPQPELKGVDRGEFQSILDNRLKLSGHAQTRIQSRNIELNPEQWDRIMAGVERAAAKGAKESLVMVDDVALVVSVKNKTVITAVDKASLKDNVFTNIDSAVVV